MRTERASAPVAPSRATATITTRRSTTSDLMVAPNTETTTSTPWTAPPRQLDPSAPPSRARGLGLKTRMVVVDTLTITLGLILSFVVYPRLAGHTVDAVLPVIVISVPVWPVLFAQQGLFQARHLTRRIEELRRLVNAVLMGVVAMAGISVVLQVSLSRGWLLAAGLTVFLLVAIEREITRQAVKRQRLQGRMSRKVVLVGDNSEAQELIGMLRENRELGYDVVGRISDQPTLEVADDSAVPYLGCTEDALELVRASGASSVVVATTSISLDSANRLVRDLTREGIYVELSSAMRDIATRRVTLRPLGRYPVMCVEPVTSTWRSVSKRAFDIVAATIGLILVSPVLLAAMAAIRITSGPGVLFSQTRVGRNGAPFTVYKLRTMVPDAESMLPELMARNEAAGPMFKMADDPRVTPIGHLLRKTSLDELPQLLNVVTGDMSLVGPRPALPHEAVQWNDDLKERLRVKPGMTGNWQVNGRFTASLEDYQRLDLYYVDNWSLVTDLVILAKTIPAVLHRNGAA